MINPPSFRTLALAAVLCASAAPALAQPTTLGPKAWMNRSLSAERRATLLVDAMTLDEQIILLRPLSGSSLLTLGIPLPASLPASLRQPKPAGAIGSAAYVPAIPRLGWPALQESDAGLGVGNVGGFLRPGDEATALPAGLALASTFDPDLARAAGAVVGAEAHAKGFNVQLAGGADLTRDPRNGRNFEYAGEDPLLAGKIAGAAIAGIQSRHIVSTVKHYALNDEETGRTVLDARMDPAAMRESDLLAFQIAVEEGRPGSVMCAYNRINGAHACENDFLLNTVLKTDWRYPGWVMTDWGAGHSLKPAIDAGLDQQSPQGDDPDYFAKLADAVARGEIPRAKVRDMALRIVRALIVTGAVDDPANPGGAIDKAADAGVALRVEQQGAVLLKNDGVLPLAGSAKRIAVIGGHADVGVISGGGSSQVAPYGGALNLPKPANALLAVLAPVYDPSSPLAALKALRPDAQIVFDDGADPARAAQVAKTADVAFVFAVKWQTEGSDAADLSLPDRQDGLIAAVADANPHTVVVLETGNPVAMPWLGKVGGVLEAWYPGQKGGEAIAALLTGRASPQGRLPMTFPADVSQLPRPKLDGLDPAHPTSLFGPPPPAFTVTYTEGSDTGYRWWEKTAAKPLFPFGYGLTYSRFEYRGLKVSKGPTPTISFTVANVGKARATELAQVYIAPPGRTHRLVGWTHVTLAAGQSQTVQVRADPRLLASYGATGWVRTGGHYDIQVGGAAGAATLHGGVELSGR